MPIRVRGPIAIRTCHATHFIDDGKSGVHCTLGRILVRAWKAEIGEYAVAHEFCDEPAKSSNRASGWHPDSAG